MHRPGDAQTAAYESAAFLFSPDDEAEDGHDQVNQTLRGGKPEDVFMVRGQPSLYAQVLLNAGRDEKAGQQGIRPEKEALRERCGGEHGGTQWQRFFAFADGVNQRDGFREAKAVVIVFLKQRVADAAAVAEAVRAGPGRGE